MPVICCWFRLCRFTHTIYFQVHTTAILMPKNEVNQIERIGMRLFIYVYIDIIIIICANQRLEISVHKNHYSHFFRLYCNRWNKKEFFASKKEIGKKTEKYSNVTLVACILDLNLNRLPSHFMVAHINGRSSTRMHIHIRKLWICHL